ncbi:hypothetical protein GEV33_008094 [Tenebrio molitor]|jgi:hypothetical protein|uniref:Uncharacterized protein n=1 Tax=Tenebrio molitor TaxID=7067 RepID=A0A8J6LBS3_TENMO|nr:hypothetical protein GEV33_008094 [Tenebrio molitor]
MKVAVLLLFSWAFSAHGADVYVHMMPWFETKESNSGQWGIHWTMANRNPDNVVDGKQDIASFYHPEIGAYASGDPDVVDWQLGAMKTAGIKGAFIDWPGTTEAFDYPKNKENAEAIIDGTVRAGLQFAVVYEDNNLNLAGVGDKIAQGTADMQYVQSNYFSKGNYVQLDGAPLLLDFGPQALYDDNWDQIFSPLDPKPTFLTLWNQNQQGGSFVKGEYAWVYSNYLDGLNNWYNFQEVPIKVGVAYPGFNSFYEQGGWPGPGFTIEFGTDTFQATFDLALANTDVIQICTWNDYGEGTIIEPTLEFGTQFLDIIQAATGTQYTHADFDEVTEIFLLRKQHANNATMLGHLAQRYHNLVHKFD